MISLFGKSGTSLLDRLKQSVGKTRTELAARVEQLLHAMREDVPDLTQHDAFLWLGDPRTGRWTRASSLASPETLAALVLRMEAE